MSPQNGDFGGGVNMALTGMETWAIIAPVLAAEMVTKHDIATDAYITTFHALKEYDERRKEARKNG